MLSLVAHCICPDGSVNGKNTKPTGLEMSSEMSSCEFRERALISLFNSIAKEAKCFPQTEAVCFDCSTFCRISAKITSCLSCKICRATNLNCLRQSIQWCTIDSSPCRVKLFHF